MVARRSEAKMARRSSRQAIVDNGGVRLSETRKKKQSITMGWKEEERKKALQQVSVAPKNASTPQKGRERKPSVQVASPGEQRARASISVLGPYRATRVFSFHFLPSCRVCRPSRSSTSP
jgi:hypothetical protein